MAKNTWKLVSVSPVKGEIAVVEDPSGKVIGSRLKGTGNRWQVLSEDCLSFECFEHEPTLSECIAVCLGY